MAANSEFPAAFEQLRAILKPYASKLTLKADTPNAYSLDGPYSAKWKKVLFFAAVQIKKNYVSYYLMPVYIYPQLLMNISPELKRRMQGKSCFNFKKVEPKLFAELKELTRAGANRFTSANGA